MKYVCRICIKQITEFNLVARKPDELSQIKMQLSICIPEMDVDLVKDPVYCKSCVSILHSAYNFKNQCLQTEERILNYSRKILSSKSIDINDLLYDWQQSTRNGVFEDIGEGENTKKEDFRATPSMNLLLSDKVLVNGQNLNTQHNTDQQLTTFSIDPSNKINNANNVTENADDKTLLDDPLRITLIQSRVFKQEGENENNITIKEENTLLKMESSSYEGYEDNVYEDAQSEGHTADVKNMNSKSAILQTNIVAHNCFVKLTRLPLLFKHEGEDGNKSITTEEENRTKSTHVLEELQKQHYPKKRFSCASCEYHTNFSQSLKYHIQTHTGEKPFACNVCTYCSAKKSSLKRHLRIHSGEKPFSCNVCTYRSAQQVHLQEHLRIHTGEKPFACNVCTYRSSQKSSLQKHLQTHTGEKPFACNICTYRSTRKQNLNRHVRIHSIVKPFACNVCTYRFAQKSSLEQHLRVHTGEKSFACNVCNFCSAKKSCLRKHLQTHPGEKAILLQDM